MENTLPVWEASKENVLPLKRGRSVKGLSQNLEKSYQHDMKLQEQEKHHENQLNRLRNTDLSDKQKLLEEYLVYFKWVCDSYPSNSEKALKILEKCTAELKDDPVLKNDIRFVKFWIEYADMVRTPNDVFAYMNSNKIGDKVSLFWIAWAFIAEKSENYKLTDQIFQKGIRHLAEPKDILQKRYQQFQRRLARHYINLSEANGGQFPMTSSFDQPSSATSSQRQPLRAVSSSHSNDENAPSLTHGLTHGLTSRGLGNPQTASKPSSSSTNRSFQVFSDTNVPSTHATERKELLPSNPHWKVLGTEHDRQRENAGPITMWSEGPLSTSKVGVDITASTIATTVPIIPIFVDESCKLSEANETKTHVQQSSKPALSIRKNIEGDSDRITKDPLARHKQGQGLDQSSKSISIASTHSTQKESSRSKPTKESDSIPNMDPITTKSSKSSVPFTIFTDTPKEPVESTKVTSKPKVVFTLFSDHEIIATDRNSNIKNMGILTDENDEDDNGDDDGDGKTINTRLAMKDIDRMFCSPSTSPCVSPVNRTTFNHCTNTISATTSQKMNHNIDGKKQSHNHTNSNSSSSIMSARRPFLASNFETITGLPSDLSAIHETSREDSSYFGSLALTTPNMDGKGKQTSSSRSRSTGLKPRFHS